MANASELTETLNQPIVTNDAVVFGLLMCCLGIVFYTSQLKKLSWFYKIIPALLITTSTIASLFNSCQASNFVLTSSKSLTLNCIISPVFPAAFTFSKVSLVSTFGSNFESDKDVKASLGLLKECDIILPNKDEILYTAIKQTKLLIENNYLPPLKEKIIVAGKDGYYQFKAKLENMGFSKELKKAMEDMKVLSEGFKAVVDNKVNEMETRYTGVNANMANLRKRVEKYSNQLEKVRKSLAAILGTLSNSEKD